MSFVPFVPFSLTLPGGRLYEASCPQVMGILNVTPDSFYPGSRATDFGQAAERVRTLISEGADMIDIGAYSSRPGASVVGEDEELRRLEFGMKAIRSVDGNIPVSVDTFRSRVARKAVEEMGADIVNDISGGDLDTDMWSVVADMHVPYVAMHMRGTPATMSGLTDYEDVVSEVIAVLADKAQRLASMGVADVIVDPGFGFSKTVEQNYQIMRGLGRFAAIGRPLLVGVSRKSMITRPLAVADALPGTVALGVVAVIAGGAGILRVHDVAAARQSVDVLKLVNLQP